MMLYQTYLVLLTGCSLLLISEAGGRFRNLKKGKKEVSITTVAPTSYCDSRPFKIFYDQVDDIFVRSAEDFQYVITNNPVVGASFQPLLDASNALRAGAVDTMEATTGCVSPYSLIESPSAPPKITKTKKGKVGKKSAKKVKIGKKSKGKKRKATEEPETIAPAELDVPAIILDAIANFVHNIYFMNSYNTPLGTQWTYASSATLELGYEPVPERDIEFIPGAFNVIVCGYKELTGYLVSNHEEYTLTTDAADFVAEREIIAMKFFNATGSVDYC
mmetsp:Transcript_41198/g.49480  ORF Transcript_41198/g.49480 Transcript_41198/m.49480 type:complete len:275 (-) Transcript_41198:59-883(-)